MELNMDHPEQEQDATSQGMPGPAGQPGNAQQQKAALQNIKQMGQTNLPAGGSEFHTLTIIGQVEGHMVLPPRNKATKYEHVIPQLVAIEQSPTIKGVAIILNTVGGDIEAGLAIAEMIKTMSKPSVSVVLGGGHSIGAPIAVAADYSFITETATMTIHPVRLTGLVIGVPQTYEYLDKMQHRILKFIVNNSNIHPETLKEMMFRTGELVRDVGTVLIGEEAVECGLIDEVGGLSSAINKLRELSDRPRQQQEFRPTHQPRFDYSPQPYNPTPQSPGGYQQPNYHGPGRGM